MGYDYDEEKSHNHYPSLNGNYYYCQPHTGIIIAIMYKMVGC
jgi:hypothetical protein